MTENNRANAKTTVATRDARINYAPGIAKIVTEANETAARTVTEKSA